MISIVKKPVLKIWKLAVIKNIFYFLVVSKNLLSFTLKLIFQSQHWLADMTEINEFTVLVFVWCIFVTLSFFPFYI